MVDTHQHAARDATTLMVVIIDDHPIVRTGMSTILARADGICVVSEGETGADAIRLTLLRKPDVLILDINLPDMDGLQVTRQLRAQGVTLPILILTAYEDARWVFGLLEAGATGYVLKDEAIETLVDAVRAVARGENWFSPEVRRQLLQRALLGDPKASKATSVKKAGKNPGLTPREIEVLQWLARGLDNAAIARCLNITRRTTQNHVSSIYNKLNLSTRTAAALWAIRHGLVTLESDENCQDEG